MLQRNHLAFWARLREEGHVLVNGPFTGQPDPTLRGVAVIRTSVEEASRLAHEDPSVQEGRLVLEIFRWLVPPERWAIAPPTRSSWAMAE